MAQRLQSPAVTMAHPARWLAVLRIVVGLYFVKSLITKMSFVTLGGMLPLPAVSERWLTVMPKIVAKQASENPLIFYKQFLEGTVLPHSSLFAQLTAWGETVTGLGLTLGLLTGVASLVGLVLVINYGLATQWMSPGQQGFHLVLLFLMLAFFFARAGRTWGIDGWLARRRLGSFLSRRPFS
jgi:thiosulfate dehydrogenase (quinone) large subunit